MMGEPMPTRRLRSCTLLFGAALIGLLSIVQIGAVGAQRGTSADSAIAPYPGAVQFCE